MLGRSFGLAAACLLTGSVLFACSSADSMPPALEGEGAIDSAPEVDETGDELARPMWFATEDTAVCPTGATFDDDSGFCVAGGQAVGPFTHAMIAACKSAGEQGCDEAEWPLDVAKQYRGADTCPAGATVDPDLGVCVEDGLAYGPFDQPMIDDCAERGGGDACSSMVFKREWIAPLPEEQDPADDIGEVTTQSNGSTGSCSGLNARMASYYGSRRGYSNVTRAGIRTLGSRHNGCATWLSHAIRQSGGQVRMQTTTNGLRDELKRRGWVVIRNKADLRPGDVIITKDRRGYPGHPDHVYMFEGWADAGKTRPLAVDNQGFTHARGPGKSPIAYGLRAPDSAKSGACATTGDDGDASAPEKDNCKGKQDGWYCSDLRDFSAYECKNSQIIGGWQCADNTVCRPDGSGHATLYGKNPGCFGSK